MHSGEDHCDLPEAELNERAQHLLKVLIERHIRTGQPIGSRTLARDTGLGLSSATVRNVMADLEELGFLQSPHTSAGRIPTARGYRFFVDSLLHSRFSYQHEVAKMWQQINPDQSTDELLQSASSLLSSITHMAGVVTVPRRRILKLRHVEFLALSDNRILAILVVNEREVQNRIISTGRSYTQNELEQAANFVNMECAGKDIRIVRKELLRDLRLTQQTMNQLMQTIVEIADKTFGSASEETQEDYVLAGQTNLMSFEELADLGKLQQLFEAFNHKHIIFNLLDQCLNAERMQIFIGQESGFDVLDMCSVVTAPYAVGGKALGVLGVIGPTRMAYERVIPIVEVTAKLLASALNSRH